MSTFTRTGELHIDEDGYIRDLSELRNAQNTGYEYPKESIQKNDKFYLRCIVETRGGMSFTMGFWVVYGKGVNRTNYKDATPLYGVNWRGFKKETDTPLRTL